MKSILLRKAQSISDYVLLIAIVSAALVGMQTYMRRGLQGAIKSAADEMGSQKDGAVDIDYKNKWYTKGASDTVTSTSTDSRTTLEKEGKVTYEKIETEMQAGILSHNIFREKD